jgi:hypothetical protein
MKLSVTLELEVKKPSPSPSRTPKKCLFKLISTTTECMLEVANKDFIPTVFCHSTLEPPTWTNGGNGVDVKDYTISVYALEQTTIYDSNGKNVFNTT